jgi:hypothetical protein
LLAPRLNLGEVILQLAAEFALVAPGPREDLAALVETT